MRIAQLDVLRAIAVLLVLGRHITFLDGDTTGFGVPLLIYWKKIGWLGVDLFFVLSGFLVSGLLFREYQRWGQVNIKRFLVRRGCKIYPPFYFFLFVCTTLTIYSGNKVSWRSMISELFFLQNYVDGVWGHTWSLAVEEHFYLLLAALFGLLCYKGRSDAFKRLPLLFAFFAISLLVARILNSLLASAPYTFATHMEPTHLRIDSLLFGVLLAYWYYFNPGRLMVCTKYPVAALCLAALLLTPVLTLDLSDFYCHTIGLTLDYIAFGIILIVGVTAALPGAFLVRPLVRLLAAVGANSYSIYLWHLPIRKGVLSLVVLIFPDGGHPLLVFLCYALASLVFGTLMAKCFEKPTIALRDRLFPSLLAASNRPLPTPVAAEQIEHSEFGSDSKTGELLWKPTCQ